MLNRQPGDRTVPTLITLLVVGLLLMTFDVRSDGGGVTGVLRTGTQTIISPLQKAASFAVNPVLDLIESVTNVATLRESNLALQQEVAELEAELIAVTDDLARLEIYERLYELETSGTEIGRTVANVIGRPGPFDQALFIDKGSASGVAVGQPVIDSNGYVVGSVQQVTRGSATVVPITVGPDAVAVTVESQLGVAVPQLATNEMRLEIIDAREPVLIGQKVVTSSASVRFPAGLPVGEIGSDAAPSNDGSLDATVTPYVNPDGVRVVVILAWPPDPVAAVTDEDLDDEPTVTTSTTTSTTISDSTTTTEGG